MKRKQKRTKNKKKKEWVEPVNEKMDRQGDNGKEITYS